MKRLKFDYVAGTGGIGTGTLFRFLENETLGRNESRLADLMDIKDYCKLHIILHYIAAYVEQRIPVYAIGRVGDDAEGKAVTELMGRCGINCEFVNVDQEAKTMYSVCYLYPDSDGGNITARNSASGNVTREDVDAFFCRPDLSGRGIALAAPEVALDVRTHLLRRGRERGCFNVASFASDEMSYCMETGVWPDVDLLAINLDEMESLLRLGGGGQDGTPAECYQLLREMNANIQLIVTQGGGGAQFFVNGHSERVPAIWKPVSSTAGAGDCFLATVVSGLVYGVPFCEGDAGVGLGGLASLASSIKVACKDTIDFGLNRKRLLEEADQLGIEFSEKIMKFFFG